MYRRSTLLKMWHKSSFRFLWSLMQRESTMPHIVHEFLLYLSHSMQRGFFGHFESRQSLRHDKISPEQDHEESPWNNF